MAGDDELPAEFSIDTRDPDELVEILKKSESSDVQ